MNVDKVAIGEWKKGFSRIVKRVSEKGKDVIITKRGKRVAVLIPFEGYKEISRLRRYLNMLRIADSLEKYGITATRIHEGSRKELEVD